MRAVYTVLFIVAYMCYVYRYMADISNNTPLLEEHQQMGDTQLTDTKELLIYGF